tara:strand:- start:88 stop:390 length:303 start_codon:yes stop_codon:yes gene_type:complete
MMLSSLRIAKSLDDGLDAKFSGTGLQVAVQQHQQRPATNGSGVQKRQRSKVDPSSLGSREEGAMDAQEEKKREEEAEQEAERTRKEEEEEQRMNSVCALM